LRSPARRKHVGQRGSRAGDNQHFAGGLDASGMKNRLKVLRAERNWSQADLGERLGVSRQAVNAIETGKYDPSLPLAIKLARLFEMGIEEIFEDGAQANG
jgi:putative transcriptional regulator